MAHLEARWVRQYATSLLAIKDIQDTIAGRTAVFARRRRGTLQSALTRSVRSDLIAGDPRRYYADRRQKHSAMLRREGN
jgi:hypothetical protein